MEDKSDEELMEVCKEFESYLLEQVFKEMEKTSSIFGDDEDSSSSQMVDYFKDTTIAELASESTEQNSLGLAQTLYEQMKRNYNL
jgi:flagellar protein FlgJ